MESDNQESFINKQQQKEEEKIHENDSPTNKMVVNPVSTIHSVGIPPTKRFGDYFKDVLSFAIPASFAAGTESLIEIISVIFIGQLNDETLLSGAVVGSTFINLTGWSIQLGLGSGLMTLISQAFGGRQYTLCGEYLNRGMLICFIMCLPLLVLTYFGGDILERVGYPADVAAAAGTFLKFQLPYVCLVGQFEVFRAFLASLQIFDIPVLIVLITTPLHAVWCYILVHIYELGLTGASLAITITVILDFSITANYILHSKKVGESTVKFSTHIFIGWSLIFKMAIPAVLMTMAEIWGVDLLTIEAGFIGETEVATIGSILSLTSFLFAPAFGSLQAISALVGKDIGNMDIKSAKMHSFATVVFYLILVAVISIIFIPLRNYIPLMFTKIQTVDNLFTSSIPIILLVLLLFGISAIMGGVLEGLGKQASAGIAAVISTFVFFHPIAILCAFYFDMGIWGLWIGFVSGAFSSSILYFIFAVKQPWKKIAENVQLRIKDELQKIQKLE